MNKFNESVLAALESDSPAVKAAQDACTAYTRQCIYRIWHIPAKYFLPPTPDNPDVGTEFTKLAQELDRCGYIDLDSNGQPCCLTGKPAVLSSAL